MSYLKTFTEHGIKASIRPGDILWLEPKAAITDDIRKLVRENKSAIIEELQAAVAPTPASQHEPAEHLFPLDGNWPSAVQVTPEALAQVDAVREKAVQLGWTEAGLYQNRGRHPFPYGQDYGLVCFLSGAREVGEITRQYIEIVYPHQPGKPNRLYNPHVPQPWLTRSDF